MASTLEENKEEAENPYGTDLDDDEDIVDYDDDDDDDSNRGVGKATRNNNNKSVRMNTNIPRRSSTRSIKPIHAFTPTSPDDPAVKESLAKGTSSATTTSSSSAASAAVVKRSNDKSSTTKSASSSSSSKQNWFPKAVYDMIEDCDQTAPDALRWSDDGKYFEFDPDHKKFSDAMEKHFGHRVYVNWHRQLNLYGWVKNGPTGFENPVFFRGMKPRYLDLIRRKGSSNYIPTKQVKTMMQKNRDYYKASEQKRFKTSAATAAASSRVTLKDEDINKNDDDDDNDDENEENRSDNDHDNNAEDGNDDSGSKALFAERVWNLVQNVSRTNPDVIRWEERGHAFFMDKDHKKLTKIIKKEIQLSTYKSIHRRLNKFGWMKPNSGKYAGLFHHPVFSRDMPHELFAVIKARDGSSSIDDQIKEARKVRAKLARERREKAATAAASSKRGGETVSSKTAKEAVKPVTTTKRKSTTRKPEANSKQNDNDSNKRAKTDENTQPSSSTTIQRRSAERIAAEERLKRYRKIKQRYNHWTMWYIPPDLKRILDSLPIDDKSMDEQTDEDMEYDLSSLFCHEKIPHVSSRDGAFCSQSEFESRVVRDQRKLLADKDREETIVPPKGKALPSSKFRVPSNKWLKLNVGDRIDVWWGGDNAYYSASITKHQAGTTYFFLIYDEDGQSEWLDLSREDFEILNDKTQRRPGEIMFRTPMINVPTEQTPLKDNRSSRQQLSSDRMDPSGPIDLPGELNHLTPHLRYSWGGMIDSCAQLEKAGTEFPSGTSPITPLDILQDVQSLKRELIPPPPNVSRAIDADGAADSDAKSKKSTLMTLLRDIRDKAVDGPGTNVANDPRTGALRRVTDKWTKKELLDNMMRVENQVTRLSEKESNVMEKLKKAKLI